MNIFYGLVGMNFFAVVKFSNAAVGWEKISQTICVYKK